jgi:hypothetical protein
LTVDSSPLRCDEGRNPEMRKLVNFSMCEGWSGQPRLGLNELDRDDRQRESRSSVARWADSSKRAARLVKKCLIKDGWIGWRGAGG